MWSDPWQGLNDILGVELPLYEMLESNCNMNT